ncbi:GDP-Man:Man(3)GlcNAc(2)-PP-Dol alpha-1,2-mannosyltransferase isoform X2 [Bradysia coprophila]|uniref:GDP-Man:Man(3)GlcNAc(2)-PP-Dol alpha-1,2-mannosyltransferase isoform X2 n=1 Tax=Bradysia coprophila TaxID=38358 RepID=UPI00187DA23A|nr:GDP-Man:Man(3)GlcNAc(2)-PP-Dol alpha-1,2-mannosyltransferase isoform X2 [Bradysia coprophila]
MGLFCCCGILSVLFVWTSLGIVALLCSLVYLKRIVSQKKSKRLATDKSIRVGIFHPYCNAGGGGERVLWCAVRALQKKDKNMKITIYTGDVDAQPKAILTKAKNTFNVSVDEAKVDFVFLTRRNWIEAEKYPYFTLLGQSLGSVWLGIEALLKHQPDVFIDTMGYAFTLPLFKYFGGCKVGCYVHYPTISTDMLKRVKSRTFAHNNRNIVAKNPFLTWLKLTYYRLFAWAYSLVGRSAQTIMVNSSWTENHILSLWDCPFKTHRVYPPCEVSHLKKLQHVSADDSIVIMSISQFRPEKDHPLQLQAMYELRTLLLDDEPMWNRLKLLIVGSCRNAEDYERLKNMQDLSKHLSLENSVEFRVNISYQELIQCYQTASIGIHTMWNEHFGIGIVECMAAGLIMVANRSGGPLMDIIETSVGSQTGYLAVDTMEYAECLATILYNTKEENDAIRDAARASCDRFSEMEFEKGFRHATSVLFDEL